MDLGGYRDLIVEINGRSMGHHLGEELNSMMFFFLWTNCWGPGKTVCKDFLASLSPMCQREDMRYLFIDLSKNKDKDYISKKISKDYIKGKVRSFMV